TTWRCSPTGIRSAIAGTRRCSAAEPSVSFLRRRPEGGRKPPSEFMKPILELRSVVKRYGATLGVGPVDVDVREGEFLTLLGPSGCGKTTTLHVVAGLLFPDEGQVLLGGRDITRLDPQHRARDVVFRNYALFALTTVF